MTNPEGEEAGATPRGRTWWPWLTAAFVGVIALGALIGAALGTRQEPLASPGTAGARPTIVLATVVPTVAIAASTPPSPSALAPTSVSGGGPGATTYMVQPGDTLRSIAEQQYGDAALWPRIYDANRDVIGTDPDALRSGMQLRLPTQ